MPKEPTWSLSTALYVGSTKLIYDRSKTSGGIGSWVRQIREQATQSITSDVHQAAMAKLKVERSRAKGESAATSTTIGRFLSSMDDETRERMAKKFDVCFT